MTASAEAPKRTERSAASDASAAGAAQRRRPLVRHPFRRKNFQPRTLVLYLAGVAAIAAARPTPSLFLAGLALVLAGQALRLWATGYLLKTDELTVAGPYAHLRHPLYAGALLMGSGFALMAGPAVAAVVLPIGLAFYFGYYLRYKERVESERLESLYGDAFRAYRTNVPALLARLRPWRSAAAAPPRWRVDRVLENNEQTALVYTLVACLSIAALGMLRAA
ncbi:MAG: hypothetical protein DCC71_16495 [Proteobacteria bacterium]|nr:MAG: hypothetical protein DCC71_16495 [Pseudomonadota bacterium]